MSTAALDEVLRLRAAADYRGARQAALDHVAALEGEAPDPDGVAVLVELGRLHEELGDEDGAEAVLRRAVEAGERLDAPEGPALLARALTRLAVVHRSQVRPADADLAARRALSLVEEGRLAPAVVAEVLVEAAHVEQDRGDHEAGAALLERATAAAAEAPDDREGDGVRALTQGAVASGRRKQGRYQEAEVGLTQAIAGAEAAFGPRSLEVADLLNELGIVYKFSGGFTKAEPVYLRSLEILTAAAGTEEHPGVASLYHNLGGLGHARGDYAAAEPFARRSVEIREATVGPDHLHTAADRAALASIVDALGRHDEAESLLQQALEAFEQALGPDHYEVAVTFNNLAAIEQRRGHLTEAEALYRRSLAIKQRVLGPRSPETGFTMNNLAVVCRKTGRPEEAEGLYREALAVFEAGLEPTHPSIVTTLANYAGLLRAIGRTEEAASLQARADALEGAGEQEAPGDRE